MYKARNFDTGEVTCFASINDFEKAILEANTYTKYNTEEILNYVYRKLREESAVYLGGYIFSNGDFDEY